jgi:hypothetical protein
LIEPRGHAPGGGRGRRRIRLENPAFREIGFGFCRFLNGFGSSPVANDRRERKNKQGSAECGDDDEFSGIRHAEIYSPEPCAGLTGHANGKI